MAADAGLAWEVSPDGDAAVVLAFPARLDPAINARCVAVAGQLRRRRIRGVRDVVEAFATVTVHFDPRLADGDAIAAALGELAAGVRAPADPDAGGSRREIRLPVCYGGAHGPDLADVARFAGCSEAEVVERHAGARYRVYMLGFLPGFAYMGAVDPRIAAPRRATPRVHVPAGSVGIASRQTGVYPLVSPGGWQLIGRTPMRLFDRDRPDPFLFSAGDFVRFEPLDEAPYAGWEAGRP